MRLKHALRVFVKTPSVTIIATLSLALGIGSTAAIFSLFNQLLLRALPVDAAAELVNMVAPGPKPGSWSCNQAGECDAVFSYPMFRDLEREQTVFTGIAAHRTFGANLSYKGQTLDGGGMLVSGSYFSVLGLRPALGRLLGPADDPAIGQSPVVVLSHAFWRTRFREDPAVLNDKIAVNGQNLTIVGVAPAGFDGTTLGVRPQIYVPITLRGLMEPGFDGFGNRTTYWAYLFARLKPGVSMEQARVGINGPYHNIVNDVEAPLQSGMTEQTMEQFKARRVMVEDGQRGQSVIHQEAAEPLTLLLGITGFVLLIACANVANLLLARAAARTGEMAVRLSIGASRWQLIRQLLTEALMLASLGGLAGLVMARWTLDFIAFLLPSEIAATLNFVLDLPVLLFAAALTIGTGLVFGLFPAIHSTRPDVLTTLKGQTGQPSGARAASRFRTTLATVQIALSMMLLVGAGLFTKSLFKISQIDLGLKPDHILRFGISPVRNGYKPADTRALFERVEDDLAAIPGVTSVTSDTVPLLAGDNWGNNVSVQGLPRVPEGDYHSNFNQVGSGYFRTLGIPLLSGREFTKSDALGSPQVAIVNETFARKFNLGRDAVGKRMATGSTDDLNIEIVGLVKDAKYSDVKDEVPPLFFTPARQNAGLGFMTFYVQTALEPENFLPIIQPTLARLDPNLPVEGLRTLPQQVRENVFEDRAISVLSASFAVLATILAAVGLYGVLAYTVAQRTREFGVRMALGAEPRRVRSMVLRQVGWMTLIGGAFGLVAAIGLGQAAQSMLFDLKGYDPAVVVTAAVLLGVVSMSAGFIPAHRASRIDPMKALRHE